MFVRGLGVVNRLRSGSTVMGLGGAQRAVQCSPQRVLPALRGGDPGAVDPWWLVSYVLLMATFKVGDPVTFIVLMEVGDFLQQAELLNERATSVSSHRRTYRV